MEAGASANVWLSAVGVRGLSPIRRDLETQGKIQITGCVYDLDTGRAQFLK